MANTRPGSQVPRQVATYPAANRFTPAIPQPAENISNLAACVQALKAGVESLTGQRGDASNRAVTFNDLIAYGLLSPSAVRSSNGGADFAGGGIPPPVLITLTGDVTGVGIGTIPTTLATVNINVGTFQGITVNAKGLVTSAADQGYATIASLAAYAPLASPIFIGNPTAPTPPVNDNDTSIATTAFVTAAIAVAPNKTITLSGDVTGTGTSSIVVELSNTGVVPGTYTNTNLIVDEDGRITAASNGTAGTGGIAIIISDTSPVAPVVGQLWWDSISGQLFIWYTDPNSSQWVIANSGLGGAGLGDELIDGGTF